MRAFAKLLFALLLSAAPAYAQVSAPPKTNVQDEGAAQGAARTVNCTGAGVSCSVTAGVWTLNATGGGGSANVVSVEVNFGAAGSTVASTVVTGQTWVTGTSIIICSPTMLGTADRAEGEEDAVAEELTAAIHTRVVSTGFTLTAHAPNSGTGGRYIFHCTGS